MRIFVATEDSAPTLAAIRFGARLAAAARGELVVLTGARNFPHGLAGTGGLGSRLAVALNEAARAFSAKMMARARMEAERTGARVRFETLRPRRVETFAETISRAADRERSDLVVIGTRGGTANTRILGTFANQLVHVIRRPVAIVPETHRGWAARVAKIMVAIDGSRPAAEAVCFSARLAARIPKSRIVVLQVSTLAADLSLIGGRFVKSLGFEPDLRRADRQAARVSLEGAAREARQLGARVTVRYLAPRKKVFAERAIVSEAAREHADLIVVGNSGRSALGDAFLGSVAQRVVFLARRPVVLVRARRR